MALKERPIGDLNLTPDQLEAIERQRKEQRAASDKKRREEGKASNPNFLEEEKAKHGLWWGPPCTHTALKERPIGDLNLSPEQLQAIERQRKEQRAAADKKRREEGKANNPNFLEEEKAKNELWRREHPDRPLAWAAESRGRARASGVHTCKLCNKTFASAANLQRHEQGRDHKAKEDGTEKEPSARALKERAAVQKNRAVNKYYCRFCRVPFNIKGHLDKHNKSKTHRAKEEAAASSSASAEASASASASASAFPSSSVSAEAAAFASESPIVPPDSPPTDTAEAQGASL